MSEDAVEVREGQSATIVAMDDGKVNALSLSLMGEIAEGLDEALDKDKPIVITGNQRAFSAGLDLKEVPMLDEDGLRDLFGRFEDIVVPILEAPVPVTSAIDGFAIAGGAIIALATDYRIASPNAEIGATELNVGIPFPPSDLNLFTERLPARTIRRTILKPERSKGQTALDLGWTDAIAEDPLQEAVQTSTRLGGTNEAAFQDIKHQLNANIIEAWNAFDEDAQESYVEMLTSKQTQQAILEGIEDVMG